VLTARAVDRGSRWVGIALLATAVVAWGFLYRSWRWEAWARYEGTKWWLHTPFESHRDFRVWQSTRGAFVRARVGVLISVGSVGVAAFALSLARLRRRSPSWWLLVAALVHLVAIGAYLADWGFGRGPPDMWGG
jgi:hypothetical protein